MSDYIQSEPPRRPNYEPAETAEAHDPLVTELRRRVQVLEKEKRRWQVIGIGALVLLLLGVLVGGAVGMSTASYYTYRLRQEQMQAQMEAMRAEMEAAKAQEALERARRKAAQ